jgi:talin
VQQSRITSVLTEPQRALLSTISAGHDVIVTAEKELETKAQIPELGSDPVSAMLNMQGFAAFGPVLSHSL